MNIDNFTFGDALVVAGMGILIVFGVLCIIIAYLFLQSKVFMALENKKAKDKWLYEYLTCQERLWAWEQWKNSMHKTFEKWFKEFIKPKWKESNLQSFRINKKLILIKKEEKN